VGEVYWGLPMARPVNIAGFSPTPGKQVWAPFTSMHHVDQLTGVTVDSVIAA